MIWVLFFCEFKKLIIQADTAQRPGPLQFAAAELGGPQRDTAAAVLAAAQPPADPTQVRERGLALGPGEQTLAGAPALPALPVAPAPVAAVGAGALVSLAQPAAVERV